MKFNKQDGIESVNKFLDCIALHIVRCIQICSCRERKRGRYAVLLITVVSPGTSPN